MVHLTLLIVAPEGILCCFRAGKPVCIINEVQLIFFKKKKANAPKSNKNPYNEFIYIYIYIFPPSHTVILKHFVLVDIQRHFLERK